MAPQPIGLFGYRKQACEFNGIFICLVIIFRNNADFQYRKVKKEELTLVFEYNILKLKFKNLDSNFGTLIDVDQSSYEAYEIHFHTPGTSNKEIL